MLLFLLGVAAAFGSIEMRKAVITRVRARAAVSSSMVFGRPYALSRGLSLKQVRLTSRLQRLDYRQVSTDPSQPGEYRLRSNRLDLFVRDAKLPRGFEQEALPVRLDLDGSGRITDIRDAKYNRELKHVWLEPEVLSLLGEDATRAVT
ncbi:MAG: hypothetical protein KDD69_15525, partial [Bdellovibrionales bacterium]|nr:hypothetical protein [Bdellovibrionales bacterium]